MKKLNRVLRIVALAMVIALACLGVGIAGGIPVPEKRRRENIIELRTEIKNQEENESETTVFYKQE